VPESAVVTPTLLERYRAGEVRALSRAITVVESGGQASQALLGQVWTAFPGPP
jgi:putative protein kinase ArgK-like GTPase of G3E family